MNPIVSGFRRIGQFSGRDSRRLFWPYAAVVLAAGVVAVVIIMSVQIQALTADMQAFAVEHPDRVTTTIAPDEYSVSVSSGDPAFAPDASGIVAGLGAVVGMLILLMGAAVVRRLHDTGRSGLWALPAPIFLVIGLTLFTRVLASFAGPEPDMALFGLLFANNMAYLLSLGVLLVLLLQRGPAEPNRFGPPT